MPLAARTADEVIDDNAVRFEDVAGEADVVIDLVGDDHVGVRANGSERAFG